eukprot:Hpha_TRINITY_DN17821_c0_g1::TRINITY_DN17821_c0_g1_i1::g.177438::m.177438/K06130/LYPLA2; lysophospholipase II
MPEPAFVVWLHGLGDSGAGWSDLKESCPDSLRHVRWHFPTAPVQPVTCNDGEKRSWFDIKSIPVTPAEPDDPKGLDESVATIHKLIKESGVPAKRVAVGGFSQGGLLACYAASTYPERLAGAISLSGWAPRRKKLQELVPESNRDLPMFWGAGTADPVVIPPLVKVSMEAYGEFNPNLSAAFVPGMGHSVHPQEMQEVWSFLEKHLA